MSTLEEAVGDLLTDQGSAAGEAVDRHFAAGFVQRVDGETLDRAAFASRMAGLREAVERLTFTVVEELVDGDRYAERHLIDLALRGGRRVRREVFVFAERDADGRFVRIDEVSVVVDGD